MSESSSEKEVFAFIALGTNQGDLMSNITQSIKELNLSVGKVVDSAHLYQSVPMYFIDQPIFLNSMVKVQTKLSPTVLLAELKKIETKLGRVVNFANGPRVIDLDITLYGNNGETVFKLEEDNFEKKLPLFIPHKLFHERNFVLFPLLDLLPGSWVHPTMNISLSSLVENLSDEDKASITRVIPFCNPKAHHPPLFLPIKKSKEDKNIRPSIMGILNVTPDSFSDGGKFVELEKAMEQVETMISAGAVIVDIGGESSRPNAEDVSAEVEASRVLPIIKEIVQRKLPCLISVDTKKAVVARLCLEAGADLINDITAGGFDSEMKDLIGKMQVPYVLMHSRGNSSTMMSKKNYSDLISDVCSELQESLDNLQKQDHFIPRWLQIIDPGIGFAKGYDQNLVMLEPKNLVQLKKNLSNRPLLIGLSRKKFLTTIIENDREQRRKFNSSLFGVDASDPEQNSVNLFQRDLASSSAACVSLLGGADILRVHDVETTVLLCDAFAHF